MAFTNYNDFRVAVQTLIEGDDTVGSTFSVNTLDTLIGLAEARVHNGDAMTPGLRASTMVEPLSLTVTANVAPLPVDLLQLKDPRFSGKPPLEIVPLDQMDRLLSDGSSYLTDGCHFAAQDGDNLTFWPSTATGTVIGSYYARPPALEDGLHTTFLRYPEVYLYASLYEAALFLGMDSKMQIWESRFRSVLDGANHAEWIRVYGAGRLRIRPA